MCFYRWGGDGGCWLLTGVVTVPEKDPWKAGQAYSKQWNSHKHGYETTVTVQARQVWASASGFFLKKMLCWLLTPTNRWWEPTGFRTDFHLPPAHSVFQVKEGEQSISALSLVFLLPLLKLEIQRFGLFLTYKLPREMGGVTKQLWGWQAMSLPSWES